jgi:hypothetical protein
VCDKECAYTLFNFLSFVLGIPAAFQSRIPWTPNEGDSGNNQTGNFGDFGALAFQNMYLYTVSVHAVSTDSNPTQSNGSVL